MFFENLVNHLESFANRGNTSFQIEDVFDDKSIPHEVYQAVNNNIHIIQKHWRNRLTSPSFIILWYMFAPQLREKISCIKSQRNGRLWRRCRYIPINCSEIK